MTYELENSKHSGKFTITLGREIHGELTIAGQNSSLDVWDYTDDIWNSRSSEIPVTITGILDDLKEVSLIDCQFVKAKQRKNRSFVRIFPHYVLIGNCQLLPGEEKISDVNFVIDDATTLFYDLDAFGHVYATRCEKEMRSLVEEIVQINHKNMNIDRKVEIGEGPAIAYYTGNREVFAVDTNLGRISASHNAIFYTKIRGGEELENTSSVKLSFYTKIDFEKAMQRTTRVRNILGLLIGRPQNLVKLTFSTRYDLTEQTSLQVYGSLFPEYMRQESHRPSVLIDTIGDQKEFSRTLKKWLEQAETRQDARTRFFVNFEKQEHYDIDRLIAAANMFDLLPDDAVTSKNELTEELKSARNQCRKIFKNLPKSDDRESVLGALGRIGKNTLKRKIYNRVRFLIEKIGARVPDVDKVTKEAVNYRNHYVHGSDLDIDYDESKEDMLIFFTNTLEFVFAASDLIEAGWDIKKWCQDRAYPPHPFAEYLNNYKEQLEILKSLPKKAKNSSC